MIGEMIRSLCPCAANGLCGVETRMNVRSLGMNLVSAAGAWRGQRKPHVRKSPRVDAARTRVRPCCSP